MKKLYVSVGILLVSAVLLAIGFTQTRAAAEGKQLPYSAGGPEFVLQEAPHPDCGTGKLKVDVQGSGQGTHIGQYTIVRRHCFDLATASITDGYFEQTAANGDKIWGTYYGTPGGVLEFDENGNPLVVIINSPWTITGGTGRFADAQGAGDTEGTLNVVTKEGNFTMEGWISYPASK
ncbi:MAG: hypothetical protein C3F07_12945 [Anaerolineales bacterium]|nr:hypothetical protein [Anaerolineae bacterium]PWB71857.1 MAG: hypothetical protein C3F07_12945 [Anaerolineales bacterium]